MATSSQSCSRQSGVKCPSCEEEVATEEVHELVWSISRNEILYAEEPSDQQTAYLSFTIGQTMDAISRWKFFILMDDETDAIDLFFRLEEYPGFEGLVGVEVSLDKLSRSPEKWEFKLARHTFTSADVKNAAPTKCVFYEYRLSEYSTWVKKGTKSYTLNKIAEKSGDEDLMQVRIRFKLFDTKGIANLRKQSDLLVMPERVAWGEIHKKGMFAMLQEGAASTITLRAKNGKEFVVNKAILAAHSPVFAAMFSTDMKEKKDGVVAIDDIGEGGLKMFLLYLFTGEVDNNWGDHYDEVINAADKYGVTLLKETCDKLLPRLVTWENCVELLHVARLYTLSTAIERIEKFMRSDPKKLVEIAMGSEAGKMSRSNF